MQTKRHNYEYAVDSNSDTAPAHVIRMTGREKRVLEIGCGPGSISRILFEENKCEVVGLERDPDAIAKARSYCINVISADLNSEGWIDFLNEMPKFDVVIAADVLEHLYDPWRVLQQMATYVNTDGYLVISLPHVGHASIISCLFNDDFQYRNYGLLDRTHIRFFGLKNMETLFSQAKLKIIDVNYVRRLPEETELASSWATLSRPAQDLLMSSSHSDIYQVVVKAVPLHFPGTPIFLTPENVSYKRSLGTIFKSIKIRISQQLGAKYLDQINLLLQSFRRNR